MKGAARICAALVAASLIAFAPAPAYAAEQLEEVASVPEEAYAAPYDAAASSADEAPIVRVGLLQYPGYAYVNDGVWLGVDAELIQNIAQHAGFRAEIVSIDSSTQMLERLDDGSIDVAADILKVDDRERNYLFSEREQGNVSSAIAVRPDDGRWAYGDIDQVSRMSIAVQNGSAVVSTFEQWCASHQLTPTIVGCDGTDAALTALRDGKVDGAILSASASEGFSTIQQFTPQPYYFAFRQSDVALKNKVDAAVDQILAADPEYKQSLLTKYNQGGASHTSFALTANERDYVSAHPVLTVAVLQDDAPFYYTDASGAAVGILPDYYQLIAQQTGFAFNFKVYASQDEAVAAVATGSADILGMYSGGLPYASNSNLRLSRAYATAGTAMVTRAGVDAGSVRTVAVKERSRTAIAHLLGDDYAGTLVGYETAQECFDALSSGKVDAVVTGIPSATWLINQANSASYSLSVRTDDTMEMCAAVAYGNSTLGSILDKAIYVTDPNYNGIVARDTLTQSDWRTFIARIPSSVIALITCVLVLLIAALVYAIFALMRRQRERVAVQASKAEADRLATAASAEAAFNRERTRFFSTVSHDMRTPLNGIMGFADLAQKTDDQERKDDYIDKIKVSSDMLLALVNDVLMVSRLDSGKQLGTPTATQIPAFFDRLVVPIQESAEMKGVKFVQDATAVEACTVIMDRLALQKILLNLLSNAVKFTPADGTVSLTLATENLDSDEVAVCAVIADTGVGMGIDFQERAFEPFVQENTDGAGKAGNGTGLGLAIVKQLVEQLGGTIALQSVRGEGTTFTVRIPLKRAVAGQDAVPIEPDAGKALPQMDSLLRGCQVLLVEDNELNAEIARTLLAQHGAIVETAVNGKLAVDAFQASPVDHFNLVLMDVRMPVMDGLRATRIIRSLQREDATRVPIVAMTADAYPDDVQRCMDAGMNAHVSKPVNGATFARVLEPLLAK